MEASQEKLIAEINDKQIKYAVFRLNNKLDCEILGKKISNLKDIIKYALKHQNKDKIRGDVV